MSVSVTMGEMEAITGGEGPQTPTVPLTLGQTECLSLPLFSFSFWLGLLLSVLLPLSSFTSFFFPPLWAKLLSYEPQQRGKVNPLLFLFFLLATKTVHHILIQITHFQFAQTSPGNTSTNYTKPEVCDCMCVYACVRVVVWGMGALGHLKKAISYCITVCFKSLSI